ncbi:MAG: hypothetical protein FJ395_00215 [Verrucomicrobia bacterium]|nr:hypothetical protein [Verrucomicrobiota bacterium]
MSRREKVLAGVLLTLGVSLWLWHVFHWIIDPDETQHMHIVWGWTQGLAQYRDIFANNMPLFHLLCAPLFAAAGERADIVSVMRLEMIPLSVVMIVCTYAISRALYSRRVGLWAVIFLMWLGPFMFVALQFRTDVLWGAVWMLGMTALLSGPLTWRRALVAGFFAGASVAVSQRTVWLLLCVGITLVALVALVPELRSRLSLQQAIKFIAIASLGAAIVPLGLIGFLVWKGLLGDLIRWAFGFNAIASVDSLRASLWWWPVFLVASALVCWGAREMIRRAPSLELGVKRAAVLLFTGSFTVVFWQFSPTLHQGVLLPTVPLVMALLAPLLLALGPVWVVLLEIGVLLFAHHRFRYEWNPRAQEQLLQQVLQLTDPGDYIMDRKGETIFRRRPYFYALVAITMHRIDRGEPLDDIVDRVIATRACVAVENLRGFPKAAQEFFQSQFLVVGRLRVAGHRLTAPEPASMRPIPFHISIPARYTLVTRSGVAQGHLNGEPFREPRFLDSGQHEYRPAKGEIEVAVIWAQAVERGFSVTWR